jgi:hypothetical protein
VNRIILRVKKFLGDLTVLIRAFPVSALLKFSQTQVQISIEVHTQLTVTSPSSDWALEKRIFSSVWREMSGQKSA